MTFVRAMFRYIAAHTLGLVLYVLLLNTLEQYGVKLPLYLSVILGIGVLYGLHWWLVDRAEAREFQRDLEEMKRELERRIRERR